MKKKLSILLALLTVVCLLPCLHAMADNSQTDTKGQSVDIVIVMDQSESMARTANDDYGNDRNSDRTVAAETIVAMCDMNGSRVAFVPFHQNIAYHGDLVELSSVTVSDSLRSTIAQYDNRSVQGGTDYGNALAYAYNLLMDREDKSNNPMIILLTDGQNYLNKNSKEETGLESKDVYFYNPTQNRYTLVSKNTLKGLYRKTYKETIAQDPVLSQLVDHDGVTPLGEVSSAAQIKTFDNEDADALVQDVAVRCQQAGIPIYTIPLYGKNSEGSSFIRLLEDISTLTGAKSRATSYTDANQLPIFFADLFADQIGSTRRLLNVTPTDRANEYEVSIPLLNRSIQEANIFIPMAHIEKSSVVLYDSTGAPRYHDGDQIVMMEKEGAFRLYKLRVDSPLGMWKIRFRTNGEDITSEDIAFSLLYNYNLTLTSAIDGAASDAAAAKSATLELTSYFFDNDLGAPSDDINLYRPSQTDLSEQDTITFTYQLLNANRQPLDGVQGTLSYDAQRGLMTATIDLRQYHLSSGDYLLLVTADGAGLHRENTISLQLSNTVPQVLSDIVDTLEVDVQGREDTLQPQSLTYDMRNFLTDADGDTLVFSNLQVTQGQDTLALSIKDSATLSVNTIKSGEHFAYGIVKGSVDVSDGDAGYATLPFSFTVNSCWALANACTYATTAAGDEDGTLQKGASVSFSMTPVDQNGAPQSVALLTGTYQIVDGSGSVLASGNMIPTEQQDALTCTYQAGVVSADLTASFEYAYGSDIVATDIIALRVVNHAPMAVDAAQAAALLPRELTYNASIYALLPFIGQEQPTATLDLNSAFSDEDAETLVFALDAQTLPNAQALACAIDGSTLTFEAGEDGDYALTVIAADNDGAIATLSLTVRVVNLFKRYTLIVVCALLLLIALIALIRFIIYLLKPSLPKDGALKVTSGAALFSTTDQSGVIFKNVRKPKQPLNLATVVTGDSGSISREDLELISLYPVKRSKQLRVVVRKTLATCRMRIDNNEPKKPILLSPDQALTLESTSDAHQVHIHYSCDEQAGSAIPSFAGADFATKPNNTAASFDSFFNMSSAPSGGNPSDNGKGGKGSDNFIDFDNFGQ